VSRRVAAICGETVARGPFTGLRLPELLPDTSAKLLGSYERELHPALERLLLQDFELVVNIGCSDGYYAVGAGKRLPAARAFAFDLNESFRRATVATAAANGVSVEVGATCTPERLRELCGSGRVLVICDCEGCERELIAPELTQDASIVLELHPGTENLPERFRDGYHVSLVESTGRDPAEYPELAELDAGDRSLAVFERMDAQSWAVIEARTRTPRTSPGQPASR
jgi:hypothetical protein